MTSRSSQSKSIPFLHYEEAACKNERQSIVGHRRRRRQHHRHRRCRWHRRHRRRRLGLISIYQLSSLSLTDLIIVAMTKKYYLLKRYDLQYTVVLPLRFDKKKNSIWPSYKDKDLRIVRIYWDGYASEIFQYLAPKHYRYLPKRNGIYLFPVEIFISWTVTSR